MNAEQSNAAQAVNDSASNNNNPKTTQLLKQ